MAAQDLMDWMGLMARMAVAMAAQDLITWMGLVAQMDLATGVT
jgi:hypothetical protein